MDVAAVIGDARLLSVYQLWRDRRQGRALPRRADIDPLDIPGPIWPHIMIIDVVRETAVPRFRYRRAGAVFWRAIQREPTGLFLDEVLPEIAGYRDYVLGVYQEMLDRRQPMYTENHFLLEERDERVLVKRVTLPLSSDGVVVDMVLTGHVFEHEELREDWNLSRVRGLKQIIRQVLTES